MNKHEVSAQNTPQIIYYSLSNLSLFGCEQKHTILCVCVHLNANKLLIHAHFSENGGTFTAPASDISDICQKLSAVASREPCQ